MTRSASILLLALLSGGAHESRASAEWSIVLPHAHLRDEAVRVCLEDLKTTAHGIGVALSVSEGELDSASNAIVVGLPTGNPVAEKLLRENRVEVQSVENEQGYTIRTLKTGQGAKILVMGGSLIGDVYGLYWVRDRMRVHKEMVDIDCKRSPVFEIRHPPQGKGDPGASKEGMRQALRYGLTWVTGENPLNLISWNSEPEGTENRKHREETKSIVDYAHSLHLKYFVYGDEFSFHPSLLEEVGAERGKVNEAFWTALQEKYRRLLQSFPEIDGVGIRTGESTQQWGGYVAVDAIHLGRDAPSWNLADRYRTFVEKVYEVVVGEFGRLYYHRTWVTSDNEQHSSPEVFKKIFTNEVPTGNLYVEPKITTTDRWYYQPFNPTFNLTPHRTIVEFETMAYHEGGGIPVFPSFPGRYYQEGLKQILSSQERNVVGVGFDVPPHDGWDTSSVTAYTAARLAWDPDEDLRTILEDFASIHFGRAAAAKMAEIYLLSATAYKDGIYVKPVAEKLLWNPLPHLRCDIFPAIGIPEIDRGRGHIEWLESTLYEPCKGRSEEAVDYLRRGVEAANRMVAFFREAEPLIDDPTLRGEVGNSLLLTKGLVETNALYVECCLAYFDYRNDPSPDLRSGLADLVVSLKESRQRFAATPGCGYHLYGIDQIVRLADEILEDREAAERVLSTAPDEVETAALIREAQEENAAALERFSEKAICFAHWEGMVGGRDVLQVRGEDLKVKHLQYDGIRNMSYRFEGSLPKTAVTVLLRDIESEPIHPFVLEQPSEANDYTAQVYLCHPGPGAGWFRFDLYYVPDSPERLGMAMSW